MSTTEKVEQNEEEYNDPITSLVNREIYTSDGLHVGPVDDVYIDFANQRVEYLVIEQQNVNTDVVDVTAGNIGLKIPYSMVRSVGDIVIVGRMNLSG